MIVEIVSEGIRSPSICCSFALPRLPRTPNSCSTAAVREWPKYSQEKRRNTFDKGSPQSNGSDPGARPPETSFLGTISIAL
jgi:hypothetical protein